MHWVWNHSQTRGNARLAMLHVADQVRTPACEVRLSYADFSAALNASRSVARAAVRAAVDSGELQIVEQGKGTRSSLYCLPKAAGFIRPATPSGPESGPLDPSEDHASGPESGPLSVASGPELSPLEGSSDSPSGPESGPLEAASGPESGPHLPHTPSKQEREPERPVFDDYGIPEWARPLIDGLSNRGVIVRWPFRANQWFPVHSLILKSGIPAMVDHAAKVAARTNVESAKYFMQGWAELPPLPRRPSPSARDSPRPTRPPCGGCDPDTRLVEIEHDGLPSLAPCPDCHPKAEGSRP